MANKFKTDRPVIIPAMTEEIVKPVLSELQSPEPAAPSALGKKKLKESLIAPVEAKPDGKTFTVYMEVDLMADVDRVAKAQGKNRSQFISDLLKATLYE